MSDPTGSTGLTGGGARPPDDAAPDDTASPSGFTVIGEAALAARATAPAETAARRSRPEGANPEPEVRPAAAAPDPVFRRRLIRAAVVLIVGAALLGVVEAWVWSRMAPGVRYQVFANQSWAPLPTETQHLFVAFAIFALMGIFTGLVLATIGWTQRAIRGVGMLLAVGIAAGVCGLIAGLLGQLWASGMDPASVAAIAGVQTIVEAPAELRGSMTTDGWFNVAYVAAPAAALIAYTVLVAWNGLPSLGRRPVGEDPDPDADPVLRAGVTVAGT